MKVRDLLTDEGKWTKRAFARDAGGQQVLPASPDAVCWCLLGACRKLGISIGPLRAYVDEHWEVGVDTWNDAPVRTFADVRRVIEALDI